MTNKLERLLEKKGHLIADGAMGTNLFKRGLETGDAPELWNVDHPDRIASVHKEFVDAGSDIILTNSFGCNRLRLKLHNAEDRVEELNKAAVSVARQVVDAVDRTVLVAASIGPTGEIFEPAGTLTQEEGLSVFKEQAEALAAAGADVLWIETMSSKEEAEVAVEAANSTGLPVVTTMTFDTNGKTMMGISPEEGYNHLTQMDCCPKAVGANCGLGATESVISIGAMGKIARGEAAIVAKANCGIPQYKDGAFHYSGTPELMARYARLARDSGARIIGGCCGSDGAVIKAIHDALEGYQPGELPDQQTVIDQLGPLTTITPPSPHGGGDESSDNGRRRRRRRSS